MRDREIEAERARARALERLLRGRIELDDLSAAVERDDAVEGGADNGGVARLAFHQRLLRPAVVGHVADGAAQCLAPARKRAEGEAHVDHRAVLPPISPLEVYWHLVVGDGADGTVDLAAGGSTSKS